MANIHIPNRQDIPRPHRVPDGQVSNPNFNPENLPPNPTLAQLGTNAYRQDSYKRLSGEMSAGPHATYYAAPSNEDLTHNALLQMGVPKGMVGSANTKHKYTTYRVESSGKKYNIGEFVDARVSQGGKLAWDILTNDLSKHTNNEFNKLDIFRKEATLLVADDSSRVLGMMYRFHHDERNGTFNSSVLLSWDLSKAVVLADEGDVGGKDYSSKTYFANPGPAALPEPAPIPDRFETTQHDDTENVFFSAEGND